MNTSVADASGDSNRSSTIAHAIVEELLAAGLKHAVLSPGSRNAPLSLALARAADSGRLQLHVHIDERSAGFLALGLAKSTARAALLVCTSGTAVANFVPAVVEAAYAQVPMLVLTADRPSFALAHGASQTIAQSEMFANFARGIWNLGEHSATADVLAAVTAAWRRAHSADAGPAHINIAFTEPLVPSKMDDMPVWPRAHSGEPRTSVNTANPLDVEGTRAAAFTQQPPAKAMETAAALESLAGAHRGVVVIGDLPEHQREYRDAAVSFAEAAGWPVLLEPTAGPRPKGAAVRHHQLVTDTLASEVDAVVSVGRFGLNRHLGRLVRAATIHIAVQPGSQPVNPYGTATVILSQIPETPARADDEWLKRWQRADEVAARTLTHALELHLESDASPTGLHIAHEVLTAAKEHNVDVFAAASRSIRDVDLVAADDGPRVWANLGVNGIDGLVATARGLAAERPLFALLGDIAFLHDRNGLLFAPGEPQPDITYVITDDDGGAIFSDLEQGQPYLGAWFERVFGTPHGLDIAASVRASGIPVAVATSIRELRALLVCPQGMRVVVVKAADRNTSHALRQALRPSN